MYRVADIKFGSQSTSLTETDVAAIHVDFEVGFDAVKLDDCLFALPVV